MVRAIVRDSEPSWPQLFMGVWDDGRPKSAGPGQAAELWEAYEQATDAFDQTFLSGALCGDGRGRRVRMPASPHERSVSMAFARKIMAVVRHAAIELEISAEDWQRAKEDCRHG